MQGNAMKRIGHRAALAAVSIALLASAASATDFSFTGNFTQDDNVQLFNFSVGSASTVTFRTYSYAGGTNAAGQPIAQGGFDPILALFDASGAFIDQNDDDETGTVPADVETGAAFDTFLQVLLNPGNYTVAVMEYDNFANGPNLSNGFARDGQGNFTIGFGCADNQPAFNDVTTDPGCGRDSHWAFDILNVAEATQVGGGEPGEPGNVPEPSTWAMMLLGFGAAGLMVRHRRRMPEALTA
jgi:PEP-CTERM motif